MNQAILTFLILLQLNSFAQQKNAILNFDYKIIEVVGDLNKDSLPDKVIVTQDTLNEKAPYKIEVFFKEPNGKLKLIVKFGDEFNDENEEYIVLPHGEFQVNVAQYIYEMIVLSIPAKRIHPGVKDGSLQSEALHNLEKFSPTENKEKETEEIEIS